MDFTLVKGAQSATPVEPYWFSPRFQTTEGITYLLAPYEDSSGSSEVTLAVATIDSSDDPSGSLATIATYTKGTDSSGWREYETATNQRSVFWTSLNTSNPASGNIDINVQNLDNSGGSTGQSEKLFADLSGVDQFSVSSGATKGTSYIVTYATYDSSSSLVTVHYSVFSINGVPISNESGILDTYESPTRYYGYSTTTLHSSSTSDPSFLLAETKTFDNGQTGFAFKVVNTDGSLTGIEYDFTPTFPADTTAHFAKYSAYFTPLLPQIASSNDYVIADPFSYTDAQNVKHFAIDVRAFNVEAGTSGPDDVIPISQSNVPSVTGSNLPDGGFVIGYTDSGQGILREYDSTGRFVSDSSFSLPSGVTNFSLENPSGNQLLVEYNVSSNAGNQLDYLTYDVNALACFCTWTLIGTPSGEVPIEALKVGDLVRTLGGEARPVTWIGHRRLDITKHPDPRAVTPVCVHAGAFGAALPARDLWMSPGHNVFVDGVLIAIKHLINGATVVQVPVDTVTYWHVELESHDVVLAEGLPAESYLDTGNRTAFENGGAFLDLHPDFEPKHWAETCAPIHKAGPMVEGARAALLARAEALGHRVTTASDPHIMADGRRFEPIDLGPKRLAFTLPGGCRAIHLASRTFVPAHVKPDSSDSRVLGVAVKGLQVDGERVALAGPLPSGWHEAERRSASLRRWTTGAATLPAGARLVVVDLAAEGRYWLDRTEQAVAARA